MPLIGRDRIGRERLGRDRIGRERIGRDLIGRERIGRDLIGRDFIGARLARIGRERFAARLAIRLARLARLTAFFACLVEVLAPSFLSLRLIRLRRFFIAIASFLLSFLTRLERLGDGLPSLTTAIPEGFLPSGFLLSGFFGGSDLVAGEVDIAGVEDPPLDPLLDSPLEPLLEPPLDPLLIEGVGLLASDLVSAFDSDLGLELELLVEDDEELPTLLIVTLLTLRTPLLAAIRIRRVFSSAADITLLEHYI